MDFPKSRIITAKQLAKVYKNASDTQRFCFILGAGASVESGIVDGKELEMRWMEKIMEERENYQDFLNTAQALLDEKKIKHPFSEIKEQWKSPRRKANAYPANIILICTSYGSALIRKMATIL